MGLTNSFNNASHGTVGVDYEAVFSKEKFLTKNIETDIHVKAKADNSFKSVMNKLADVIKTYATRTILLGLAVWGIKAGVGAYNESKANDAALENDLNKNATEYFQKNGYSNLERTGAGIDASGDYSYVEMRANKKDTDSIFNLKYGVKKSFAENGKVFSDNYTQETFLKRENEPIKEKAQEVTQHSSSSSSGMTPHQRTHIIRVMHGRIH